MSVKLEDDELRSEIGDETTERYIKILLIVTIILFSGIYYLSDDFLAALFTSGIIGNFAGFTSVRFKTKTERKRVEK